MHIKLMFEFQGDSALFGYFSDFLQVLCNAKYAI